MHLAHPTDPPPLEEHQDGVIRVAGTRIPLERVVRAFLAGATPEQIGQDYDHWSIQQVYAVVSFYLNHREEVDAYLAQVERESATLHEQVLERFDPAGVRSRLLNRQP